MKVVKAVLATGLCAAAVSMAHAAEEVTLSVTGNVVPGACTLAFLEPNIDFGALRAEDLEEDVSTQVGEATVSYTITCPSARAVGMSWVDNNPGTAYEETPLSFGLGIHNGKKIGQYYFVHNEKSDDSDSTLADLINSDDNGTTWTAVQGGWAAKADGSNMMAYVRGGSLTPAPYARHTGRFYLTAFVAPKRELDLSEHITLEGNATLSLTYL